MFVAGQVVPRSGNVQDPAHPSVSIGHLETLAVLTGQASAFDERRDAGGIEEGDAVQVDQDGRDPVTFEFAGDRLAELLDGGQVVRSISPDSRSVDTPGYAASEEISSPTGPPTITSAKTLIAVEAAAYRDAAEPGSGAKVGV